MDAREIIPPLIYWLLVSYTVTAIICEAKITSAIRYIPKLIADETRYLIIKRPMQFIYSLLNCFLCTSVWVCGLLSIVLLGNNSFKEIFFDAMMGTTILWFMHCVEVKLVK